MLRAQTAQARAQLKKIMTEKLKSLCPSKAADCSAFFVGRLAVTDGGPPIDLYECDGSASIERGEDNEVGSGSDLFEAWNDYLYSVSQAPVDEAELASMWADYDAQNAELTHPEPKP
jgi:hypothetical protein